MVEKSKNASFVLVILTFTYKIQNTKIVYPLDALPTCGILDH